MTHFGKTALAALLAGLALVATGCGTASSRSAVPVPSPPSSAAALAPPSAAPGSSAATAVVTIKNFGYSSAAGHSV